MDKLNHDLDIIAGEPTEFEIRYYMKKHNVDYFDARKRLRENTDYGKLHSEVIID